MKTSTYKTGNEAEATALTTFFKDCGVQASCKGLVVKATGEPERIDHLFNIFVINAML